MWVIYWGKSLKYTLHTARNILRLTLTVIKSFNVRFPQKVGRATIRGDMGTGKINCDVFGNMSAMCCQTRTNIWNTSVLVAKKYRTEPYWFLTLQWHLLLTSVLCTCRLPFQHLHYRSEHCLAIITTHTDSYEMCVCWKLFWKILGWEKIYFLMQILYQFSGVTYLKTKSLWVNSHWESSYLNEYQKR